MLGVQLSVEFVLVNGRYRVKQACTFARSAARLADSSPSMRAWMHFNRANSRRLMVILTDRCRMTDLPHTQGGIPGRHHAPGGHLNLCGD